MSREELRHRFTGRKDLIELCKDKLQQDAPVPVLMFFGVGGVGKTFLMRYLQYEQGCCWEESPNGYPHAFLNFHDSSCLSTAGGLRQMREELLCCSKQLTFPRFDFLWGKHWERTYHQKISESSLISEEAGWLSELLQSCEVVPVIGDVAKAVNLFTRFSRRVQQEFALHNCLEWFREHIEIPHKKGWKAALQLMQPPEIEALLPAALAADLAEGAAKLSGQYNRVLLLVDNYETAQEQLDTSSGKETRGFIQTLAEELIRLQANVLLIIAGRDRLRWAEVRRRDGSWVTDTSAVWAEEISRNDAHGFASRFLEQHAVGDLSESDAMEYLLNRRQLSDENMARQIYEFTGGYPLSLGVVMDLIQNSDTHASEKLQALKARVSYFKPLSEEWREELNDWVLQRLLEQLTRQDRHELAGLVRAASLPRWFTEDLLYQMVGNSQGAFQDNFDHLLRYSFIEPHGNIGGAPAYHIHGRMRGLLQQSIRSTSLKRDWHSRTREYFVSQGDEFIYQLERAYHWLAVEPAPAMEFVEKVFDIHRSAYQINECRLLLKAVREAQIEDPRVEVRATLLESRIWEMGVKENISGGKHLERALECCQEGIDLGEKLDDSSMLLMLLLQRSSLLRSLQRNKEALESLEESLSIAEQSQDRRVRAVALREIALLFYAPNANMWNTAYIEEARDIFRALKDNPRESEALRSLSRAYCKSGDLRQARSIILERYKLVRGMDNIQHLADTYADMGNYLLEQGNYLVDSGDYLSKCCILAKARRYYKRALKHFEETGDVGGICKVTRHIGVLRTLQGDYELALQNLQTALELEIQLYSRWGVARALFEIANYYAAKRDCQTSLAHLLVARAIWRKIEHTDIHDAETLLAKIREQLGEERFEQMVAEIDINQSPYAEFFTDETVIH